MARKRSSKTTIAGAAAIVAAIASVVAATFDGNPATTVQWEAVIPAIAAGVGLIAARDNNRTSEEVGAGRRS